MSLIIGIIVALLVIWITMRTLSYALWNWRNGNKTGSVLVALLGIASAVLPLYLVFYKT